MCHNMPCRNIVWKCCQILSQLVLLLTRITVEVKVSFKLAANLAILWTFIGENLPYMYIEAAKQVFV